jgi:hypothetical protein
MLFFCPTVSPLSPLELVALLETVAPSLEKKGTVVVGQRREKKSMWLEKGEEASCGQRKRPKRRSRGGPYPNELF